MEEANGRPLPPVSVSAWSPPTAQSVYVHICGGKDPMDCLALERDLDLALQSEQGFPIGLIESTATERDHHRFFLSCLDAEVLGVRIDTFLRKRGVRDRAKITVRFGPYDDADAPGYSLFG